MLSTNRNTTVDFSSKAKGQRLRSNNYADFCLISILLNLGSHISLLTCPVYVLRTVLKNSTLNIKIMQICYRMPTG